MRYNIFILSLIFTSKIGMVDVQYFFLVNMEKILLLDLRKQNFFGFLGESVIYFHRPNIISFISKHLAYNFLFFRYKYDIIQLEIWFPKFINICQITNIIHSFISMGSKRTYSNLFSNITSLVEDPTFVTGKSIIFELFHFINIFSFVLG